MLSQVALARLPRLPELQTSRALSGGALIPFMRTQKDRLKEYPGFSERRARGTRASKDSFPWWLDGHTFEMQLPFTDSIWFINAPFQRVVTETTEWLKGLGGRSFTLLCEPLPLMLHHLEPRAMPSWKHLVVSTSADQWTAVFTQGSDIGTANVIGARLGCLNVFTSHQAHITRDRKIVSYGSTALWIRSGSSHVRSIQASYQSGWEWTLFGDPQPFENLESYKAKRIPDRFTLEALNECCRALGIERDNADSYGLDGMLIEEDTSNWSHKPNKVRTSERLHGLA